MILENAVGQFTKIISVRNGVYGLSGWTTRANADKATAPAIHRNKYGLDQAVVGTHAGNARQASRGQARATVAAKKTAAKKTAKKVAKKAAKKVAKGTA